jgi:uncharacterized repeat protein (TIGR01451 family)
MKRRSFVAATAIVLWGLSVALQGISPEAASAAEPAGTWQIVQMARPSNLAPGSIYANPEPQASGPRWEIVLTNVGEETIGAFTVTDTLPAGVSASSSTLPKSYTSDRGGLAAQAPCTVAGQTVTCQVSHPVEPGAHSLVYIPLDVSPSASGTVSNEVFVSGEGTPAASSTVSAPITADPLPFEFLPGSGVSGSAFDEAGLPPSAGSHPFIAEVAGEVTSSQAVYGAYPTEGLRSLHFNLPNGLVVNPASVPTPELCTQQQLRSALNGGEHGCPVQSQIGILYLEIVGLLRYPLPLYDMVPPVGYPAEFATVDQAAVLSILGGLDGNYHLSAGSTDLLTKFPTANVRTYLWGVPSDPSHDGQRIGEGCRQEGCEFGPDGQVSVAPFVSMPSSCTETMQLEGTAVSWQGSEDSQTVPFTDAEGGTVSLSGCNQLAFQPTIQSQATTNLSDSPSGLDFAIHQPQDESLTGRATATLKDAQVTLPEGVTLNAAAAGGLDSCTEEQMGYAPEAGKIRFQTTPQSCTNAAKVGTLEVTTPLQDHKLPGSIYVAKPYDNPFGSLLAIYLAIEDKRSGIVAKLAGKVEPDPSTGQLKATFTENPALPLNDVDLHFFNGPNATLQTPLACGTKTTNSTLTPWSTPEGLAVHPTDSFQTSVAASGSGACPSSEAAAPAAVNFEAGTVSPLAGAYSPFTLRIARPDGTQRIAGIDTTLPGGLLGKLAGIPYCPESAIALAKSREAPEQGKVEQASPSCPAASEVGTVQVTAGAGITPFPVNGHAYLAGPYKGAPLSLVTIVPAVAGPFDLGDVVTRIALEVGTYDAQIHAVSDPLPTIIDGIPLDVRSISLKLDRPGFTLNPTSCEAKAIEGSVTTQTGQSAPLKNRFQVGECKRLDFKPGLKLSLKGPTKRTGHPALKAVLTFPSKGTSANIAKAQVGLPHGEFLDQSNIGTVCTQPQLKTQTCPPASIYGKAKAWTPLLDKPLEGPVYLGAGFGHKLPDLVADLNGQIRVLVHGKVDTDKQGGIRNTFEAVPDAPVTKFVLEMQGGKKKGLLVNSENVCKTKQKASVQFTGQNGKLESFQAPIQNGCKGGKKHHR